MIFQPTYKSYISRVLAQISRLAALMTVIFIISIFIDLKSVYYIFLLSYLPVMVMIFIRSLFLNIYYLKSLEINENQHYIKLTIYRFNKLYKEYEIKISDFNTNIIPGVLSLTPYYKIRFFNRGVLIYQQKECSSWPIDQLIAVYKEIKRIKGQPAFIKGINGN